jgi:hypothetical protein
MFGLVAFVFTHYSKLNETQLLLVNISGFLLLCAIIGAGKKLQKETNEIKEM